MVQFMLLLVSSPNQIYTPNYVQNQEAMDLYKADYDAYWLKAKDNIKNQRGLVWYRKDFEDMRRYNAPVFKYPPLLYSPNPRAPVTPLQPDLRQQQNQIQPVKVLVSGGGPVGLMFTLLCCIYLRGQVLVDVYDSRWIQKANRYLTNNYSCVDLLFILF